MHADDTNTSTVDPPGDDRRGSAAAHPAAPHSPGVQRSDWRWFRIRDGRTYRALIAPNLWGDPTVVMCWGSAFHRGGGVAIETYDSLDDAWNRLREIAERRAQRDYLAADTSASIAG